METPGPVGSNERPNTHVIGDLEEEKREGWAGQVLKEMMVQTSLI